MNSFSSHATPREIKHLIKLARPAKWGTDYPTDVDIDELFQDPLMVDRARIWSNTAGELIAYAFVHFPYNNLTFEAIDNGWTDALEDEILAWAIGRMKAQYGEKVVHETLDGSCRFDNTRMIRFFERHGFAREPVESLAYQIELKEMPHLPVLPEGFTIRPLHPEHELKAVVALHQAAHGTLNFTLENRRAVMSTEDYLPDLDLVAVAPDSTLAGNCICSLTRSDDSVIGFTDPVVVHPSFQRLGLARALLQTGLIGLYNLGIQRVHLGTSSTNIGMQKAAEALGFSCISRQSWFSLQMSE